MKSLLLVIFALGALQTAHADQGEPCAKVFVEYNSTWSYSALVNWCKENGITDAHSDVSRYFKQKGSDWAVADLMLWAKKESLTSAQVSCGVLYDELNSSWKTADLLLYCRDKHYTKKEVSCARQRKPRTVEELNGYLEYCQANR